MLKINEIFHSIQGESTYVGNPTVFIRTTACNLRCTYCDTKYSYYEGQHISQEDLLKRVHQHGAPYVCLTGGEPLLQKEVLPLMTALCDHGYRVSLETSGSKSCREVDPRVKIILDVKTPDSGAADSFLMENLENISALTEFKFVICSERDLDWSENFCRQHDLFKNFVVLYSPSFDVIEPQWLSEQILQRKTAARLQLQLHKYIWSPRLRGV
ncbi:MAG: 7-carboxy-7-deazaguanine synthase QueE [Bdellovibrio sp. CG10_big_fil_rev_8_21_14_0_10_47_8]|nr:MAG: 7-carboxy-7-deazaguanine synthase QueE [Bdellovibrio sp. CG10_big_fil_rev_8_21_14_0_10_47_8]